MSNNRSKFKSNTVSKQETAEVIGISLSDAYDIVGGYKEADEKTLAAAIRMLENDNSDSEFALQLIKMYKSGTSLKDAKFDKVSDENLEKGLEKATDFARTAKDTERETLSDSDINQFIINTQINDIYGNRVSSAAENEGINLLSRVAEQDTTQQIILGKDGSHKDNFFKRLINLRIGSLRKNKEAKLSDAFDPKKTVSVEAQAVSDMFENSKQEAKKFDEKLENRVEKSKSSKLKATWRKYKTLVVAGFMAISSVTFMSSCSNSNKQNTPPTQELRSDTLNNVRITEPVVEKTDTIVEAAPIVMPTEYSDSLGISHAAWLSTQEFTDNTFTMQIDDSTTIRGYEVAYQRLATVKDSLDGRTIEQGLNAYRYLRSMYPNPENLASKKIDEVTIEAAKKAKELDCFLKGEIAGIPTNLDKMFIDQVPGNIVGKYATGIENPCDDGKVQYKTLHSKVKEEVAQEVTEEVTEEVAETPEVKLADEAFVLGVIQDTDTVKVQKTITATEHNGNQGLTDGKLIKDNISPEEANVEVKGADKHNVLVKKNDAAENDSNSAQITATVLNGNQNLTNGKVVGNDDLTNVNVNTDNSRVLTESSDTVTVKKKKAANLRKEMAKKAERAAQATNTAATVVVAEAEAVVAGKAEEVKADVTAATVVAEAEAVVVNNVGEAKVDTAANAVIAEAEAVVVGNVKEAKADTDVVAAEVSHKADGNGGMEEIIFGTENAPLGTPSAFDTPERGGFEGSGVTEKEIKVAKEKLGDELYDLIVNGSPDEWFNNGNIAEGLSRREWACIFAVMSETGPHQATTQEIIDAINCERKIKTKLFDAVKSDVDGVHKNRTRDGWTYDKQIYVRGVRNNGCGKKLTLDKVRVANRKKTTASGPKFPRLFRKFIGVKLAEPIVLDVIKDVDTVWVKKDITITEYNGNQGLTDGKLIKDNLSPEAAIVEVKDADKRNVLVQTNNSADIVAQEFNGNENLTDGKNLGEVEVNGDIQARNKDSKVLVNKKKGQKHLTFKEFKKKKERQLKLAQKKAQKKAAEGNAALQAWVEKING